MRKFYNRAIRIDGYSLFGTLIYKFDQRIAWSWSDGYITAVTAHYSYSAYTCWPWSYAGLASESESGGVDYPYFSRFSQGIFNLVIGGWVFDSASPWLWMEVYGDGSFAYSGDPG